MLCAFPDLCLAGAVDSDDVPGPPGAKIQHPLRFLQDAEPVLAEIVKWLEPKPGLKTRPQN